MSSKPRVLVVTNLWPENGGMWTRIEYQVQADGGGLLPAWVANTVSKVAPFKTLRALREQVKRTSYPEFEKMLAFERMIQSLPEYRELLAPPPGQRAADARTPRA